MKNNGHKTLPSRTHLRDRQKEITPAVMDLPEPLSGKFFSVVTAVKLTLRQLVLTFSEKQLSSLIVGCNTLTLKWGADGSGSHNIYNQVNNAQTSNLILTMFCALKIVAQDG